MIPDRTAEEVMARLGRHHRQERGNRFVVLSTEEQMLYRLAQIVIKASADLSQIHERAQDAVANDPNTALDAEYVLIAVGQIESNLDDWIVTVGEELIS